MNSPNSASVNAFTQQENFRFDDLVSILQLLRGEGGCPWDREQTHASIRNNLIEECYEAVEAIDSSDFVLLREELGDILLQVVFHSQIASESGLFNIDAVCDGICKKLIRRHPHVFGSVQAEKSEQVLKNWDNIKKVEKNIEKSSQVLKNVSPALPALMRSQKVQQKASREGFDWDNIDDVFSKVSEELTELKQAVSDSDKTKISDELGDVLFSVVNVARFLKVNPEEALSKSTVKFIRRYEVMENLILDDGKSLSELTLKEMDLYWEKAKKEIDPEITQD